MSVTWEDKIGKTYFGLKVLKPHGYVSYTYWNRTVSRYSTFKMHKVKYLCACGVRRIGFLDNIYYGRQRSCGCGYTRKKRNK